MGEFLQRQRREDMLRRLNEVYAGREEPGEKRLLTRMNAKNRPNGEGKLVSEIRQLRRSEIVGTVAVWLPLAEPVEEPAEKADLVAAA